MNKLKGYRFLSVILFGILLTACSHNMFKGQTLAEVHRTFSSDITRQVSNNYSVPQPPAGMFDIVYFESEVGELVAFVSSDPGDGAQHPLIIWVIGGWGNAIGSTPWETPEWDNDQTGSAFREAGVLMMYPSFRGGNGNPGYFDTMFGETRDLVAAAQFAASLPYVDPSRIYIGGHSTGGTRVLLAAAYTDIFRAVFALSPVADIRNHNRAQFVFDSSNRAERMVRSPIYWLDNISSPVFMITGEQSHTSSEVNRMGRRAENPNINTFVITGAGHFDYLAPITRLLAQQIMEDSGDAPAIILTQQMLQTAMQQSPR